MGAMLYFEDLIEKTPQELRSVSRSNMVMHYACLIADESFTMTFDEFVRAIDSRQSLEGLNIAGDAEQKRWNVKNSLDVDTPSAGDVKKK